MRPAQRVILYRAGTSSAETKTRRVVGYHDAYKMKRPDVEPCPECGRPSTIGSGQAHRLPRPNNFMWCSYISPQA